MSAKTETAPKFVFTAIPTKSERAASQLRDALRVLMWIKFRQDNKAVIQPGKEGGFEAYAAFETEWKKHPCQGMDQVQLEDFIQNTLGYTLPEINKIRSEYYEAKKGFSVKAAVTPVQDDELAESIPY